MGASPDGQSNASLAALARRQEAQTEGASMLGTTQAPVTEFLPTATLDPEALVEQLPNLRRYARFLTRDPERADDLVQACLLRALDNLGRFQVGTNLRAWLLTMMRNLYINE